MYYLKKFGKQKLKKYFAIIRIILSSPPINTTRRTEYNRNIRLATNVEKDKESTTKQYPFRHKHHTTSMKPAHRFRHSAKALA